MTRVLYIGGTGEISHACMNESLRAGHTVTVFNRGSASLSLPAQVEHVQGDLRTRDPYRVLGDRTWDVICQFLAFEPDNVTLDLKTFSNRCAQYLLISSASAYEKPCRNYLITEQTPLENPYWSYSRKKAACEQAIEQFFSALTVAASRCAYTVVRPSHTYRTRLPGAVTDGDHQAWRIMNGKPVIVHGDGQSLWTLTHAEDFAHAFVRLYLNPAAFDQIFHITASTANTWDIILAAVGEALNTKPKLCHVATDTLIRYQPNWIGPLLGDKANSIIFDNSQISAAIGGWDCSIPLNDGFQSAADHVKKRLKAGYRPNPEQDALLDRIIRDQQLLGN